MSDAQVSTLRLARRVHYAADRADDARLERVRWIFIDALSCAARATQSEAGRRVLMDHSEGSHRTPSRAEQVANLTHLEEFDCLHDASATAPGIIVPAVVDQALSIDASLRDTLRAILAGVEAAVILGEGIGGSAMYALGHWPSSFTARLGIAAGVARLHGFDEQTTARAMAIAAMTGPTTLPAEIREVHYLSGGLATDLGIRAAHWARGGIDAHLAILDDGPLRVDPTALERPESTSSVHDVIFKRFPCARPLHALIVGIERLVGDHDIEPAAVLRLDIALPTAVRVFLNRSAEPSSEPLRRTSVDYVARMALIGRAADPAVYAESQQAPRPEIFLTTDDAIERSYPGLWASRVTITTAAASWSLLTYGDSAPAAGAELPEWLADKWASLTPDLGWTRGLVNARFDSPLVECDPLGLWGQ